jgi:RNA polymerase sigma-70 factor (ECF subfamily)
MERDALAGVDPRRGRFRAFLLTLLSRFLLNERDRARAQKRGGGRIAVDVKAAERELSTGPSDDPEAAFERAWGGDLLSRAFERMRGEKHFDALELALTHGLGPTEIASHLGIKAKDAENALARARRRFRAVVLEEILLDVETPEDAEEELRRLLERIR